MKMVKFLGQRTFVEDFKIPRRVATSARTRGQSKLQDFL
jgi:hypothetical protein